MRLWDVGTYITNSGAGALVTDGLSSDERVTHSRFPQGGLVTQPP